MLTGGKISAADLELFSVTDDPDEAVELIRAADSAPDAGEPDDSQRRATRAAAGDVAAAAGDSDPR
jgi:hypothetical protein